MTSLQLYRSYSPQAQTLGSRWDRKPQWAFSVGLSSLARITYYRSWKDIIPCVLKFPLKSSHIDPLISRTCQFRGHWLIVLVLKKCNLGLMIASRITKPSGGTVFFRKWMSSPPQLVLTPSRLQLVDESQLISSTISRDQLGQYKWCTFRSDMSARSIPTQHRMSLWYRLA